MYSESLAISELAERAEAHRSHDQLKRLLQRVEDGTTREDGWEPGKAFEFLVLRAFELEGAKVHWPFEVKSPYDGSEEVLEQIDGLILADDLHCLVETKDHANRLHFEPIAKMRNQLLRRPAGTIGLIFSKMGYTAAAHQLSCFVFPQTVLLWHLEEVRVCLERKELDGRKIRSEELEGKKLDLILGLRLKYQWAVKHGNPMYNLAALTADSEVTS